MTYRQEMSVYGNKSGDKQPSPPVEAPDSLFSTAFAKILDLVSEGEIVGLVNGASSIYLDETPLAGTNGFNFSGVSWAERTGTLDQEYIKGFPTAESETTVNYDLKATQQYVKSITKLELSAIRVRMQYPRLISQDAQGNTNGSSVRIKFELQTDGGPFVSILEDVVKGKQSQKYERDTRINLPTATNGWTLRITRMTPDSASNMVSNSSVVAGITEIIDAKFTYPNSAVIGCEFDAKSFSGIPGRAFHIKGRIVRVPSNYDAESRLYFGVWDGTFKPAYTNNPAWIYYDLLLHPRYGLGNQINASQVDRYELYRIAQYCDGMVDDGKGGLEPRFTCNAYLQEQAAALRVMQDIATVFRGISYWGAGQAFVSADMPGDSKHTYTNAQVKDGMFDYRGAPLESRYNVAMVSWNDPSDFYRAKVEYVEDKAGIAKLGTINKVELTAFGCSSQGQANRAGRWALITNTLENEMVNFTVGLDGVYVSPGDVFKIADNDLAGRSIGGRILSATINSITADREVVAKAGDLVTLMVNGEPVEREVSGYVEATRTITFVHALDAIPDRMTPWAIESDELRATMWRVISIRENDDMTYAVAATKHIPDKYDNIDSGTVIEKPPITIMPPSVQPPPTNIRLSSNWAIDQTMAVTTMSIEWDPVEGAIAYEVQWRVNDKDWIYAGRSGGTEFNVEGIYAGRYVARVLAVNALDISSPWATSAETNLLGKDGEPPTLGFLRANPIVMGIALEWGFLPGSTDSLKTEIQYSVNMNEEDALLLGDYAYPINTHTVTGLAAGTRFYFRGRLHDRTGNIGAWTGWVVGMASNDASVILEYIKGKIEESSLGPILSGEIEKISGDGPGSVNDRLEAIRDLITQYTDALVYDPAKSYLKGEIVRQGQNLYQAIASVPVGAEPPNATYWKDVGAILEEANGLAGEVHNLTLEVSELGEEVRASAEKVDGIFVQLNPPMAGDSVALVGSESGKAGVWSVWAAIAEGDYTQARRTDRLNAGFKSVTAEIATLSQAITDGAASTAQQITTLTSRTENNRSMLEQEILTRQGETSSLAQRSDTLETELDGTTLAANEALSVAQSVDGKVSATWTVRLQYTSETGEYKYAGVGLGLDNASGQLQSKFVIDADMFAIQQGGFVPFAVDGGQVFMNSAFIKDGTITNAKIGDYIQSDDYVEGQQGWRLDKTGNLQFNGSVAGGGRLNINNNLVSVYDAAGTLRVRLGIW